MGEKYPRLGRPIVDRLLRYGLVHFFILKALSGGPLHNYGLVKRFRDVYGFPVQGSSLYIHLRTLELLGLIRKVGEGSPEMGSVRRKLYGITEKGRETLERGVRFLEVVVEILKH